MTLPKGQHRKGNSGNVSNRIINYECREKCFANYQINILKDFFNFLFIFYSCLYNNTHIYSFKKFGRFSSSFNKNTIRKKADIKNPVSNL